MPNDWVIKVIEGPDAGQEHRLQPGANLIGRGRAAALKLSPEDISWEHAVITRQGDEYYLENLSALGTWVGDAKVGGRVRLRPRDKVRLSEATVLRLDAEDGGGLLGSRGFLVAALVAMLSLLAAVVYFQGDLGGDGAGSGAANWDRAYVTLADWLRQQALRRKASPETVDLFHNAWRLEQAKSYAESKKAWLRLQVVLAGDERTLRTLEHSGRDPTDKALQAMLAPRPGYSPSDEDQAAALAQFVRRRLTFATKLSKTSILKQS